MPVQWPGNTVTKLARAATGGGFESAIEAPTPSDPGTAFFTDEFASGDLSKTEGGFTWEGGTTTEVVAGAGRLGGNALRFSFPAQPLGESSERKQRFFLAPDASTAPTEVWFEYYLKIPSNFKHRATNPSNNKFFALWAEPNQYSTTDNPQFVSETERLSDSSNQIRAICMTGSGCLGGDSPNPVVTPERIGQWLRVRIHLKVGDGDGLSKIWINNDLVYSIENYTHFAPGGSNYWRTGYLLGTANSGFDEETNFDIDEFKVWRQDPQWSFV